MIGVSYPFRIANGSVATTSDPAEITLARVGFCIGTQVLERVFRPGWGIELMNVAQALGADVTEVVDEAVGDAFRAWLQDLVLKGITVTFRDEDTVLVDIRYRRPDSEFDESSRIGVPVPGGSEIFPAERPF